MWSLGTGRAARSALLIGCALLLGACGDSSAPPPPALGGTDCPELSCLACGSGTECAASGAPLGETCCALGDDLVELGEGEIPEVVDIEVDDQYAYLCGGFGGRVFDVSDSRNPLDMGALAGRCQRIALGPVLTDGTRVIYVAHHGDSRWAVPYLATWHLDASGALFEVAVIDQAEVLFEGIVWRDGVLYVAAHAGGLRVYSTDDQGVPTFARAVGGFENAWKVAVSGAHLYVADDGAVQVLSIDDPLAPQLVGQADAPGQVRDLDVADDVVYAALGSGGLLILDVSNPAAPTEIDRVLLRGSIQAVAVRGDRLALASWTHLALHDRASLDLLATESLKGPLEQTLGVALRGDDIFAAEWGTGLHVLAHQPGYVAPDMWVDEGVYRFRGDRSEAQAVIIRNRGLVTLEVDRIETNNESYQVDQDRVSILPGEAAVVEVTFTLGPSSVPDSLLTLSSNDPDRPTLDLPLRIGDSSLLKVGDQLGDRFGFLDPSGAGQVSALDGKVVLLAYFGIW